MLDLSQAIAEHFPSSLVVYDGRGVVTLWNAAAQRLYGWSPAEALDRNIHDLLRSRHPFQLNSIERDLLREGRWAGDVFRTTKDGREICVSVVWTVARSGGSDAIVESAQERDPPQALDIHDSAHRYRNLFHAMSASFWELDFGPVRRMIGELVANGMTDLRAHIDEHPEFIDAAIAATRLVDVNDATVEIFGAPSREAILDTTLEWVWPEQSRHVYASALVAASRREYAFSTEVTLVRWDGHPLDLLFTVCWPQDHQARGTALVGVIDITALKRIQRNLEISEERYSRLFHAMAAGYVEFDFTSIDAEFEHLRACGVKSLDDHFEQYPAMLRSMLDSIRILSLNEKAADILHARTASELKALRTSLVPIGDEGPMRQVLAARFLGQPLAPFEIALTGMDGDRIDVVFAVWAGQSSSTNEPVLASIVDVGDRKRAEAALRQARSDYAHAARVATLGEMTASIAHEVNQPLAALSAYGQTIRRWIDRPVPDLDEVRALADYVVADAQRASGIIARIRAMSVNSAPRSEPLSISEMVLEALEIVRNELVDAGVEVKLELAEALPSFEGDRIQMQQVLVNLAINAVQAMANTPREERVIRITTTQSDLAKLEVLVEDTGPGVPADTRDRLFTSFYSTKENGMGIGLPICRSIMEAHNGDIELQNSDTGARFRLRLPGIAAGSIR